MRLVVVTRGKTYAEMPANAGKSLDPGWLMRLLEDAMARARWKEGAVAAALGMDHGHFSRAKRDGLPLQRLERVPPAVLDEFALLLAEARGLRVRRPNERVVAKRVVHQLRLQLLAAEQRAAELDDEQLERLTFTGTA